jgi:predicted PurR-regulated permease PerM
MKSNNNYTVNINLYSLFQVLLVLGGLWLAFMLSDVIVLTVLAFIISSGIILGAKKLNETLRLPYTLGVIFVISVLAVIVTLLIELIVPTISSELRALVDKSPELFNQLNTTIGSILNINDFNITQFFNTGGTANIGEITWNIVTGVFFTTQNIINTFLYIGFFAITTFYMAIRPQNLNELIQFFFPKKQHKKVEANIELARTKVGSWLLGQCLISLILATVIYPGLVFLKVPFPLLLSVIAAVFNLIPIIGPILSSIPAIILALANGFQSAVIVGLFYLVIQQIDGNFMTPFIMRKVTGIHPLIVMIIILVGTSLAGALGALIAVPVVSVLSIFIKELED